MLLLIRSVQLEWRDCTENHRLPISQAALHYKSNVRYLLTLYWWIIMQGSQPHFLMIYLVWLARLKSVRSFTDWRLQLHSFMWLRSEVEWRRKLINFLITYFMLGQLSKKPFDSLLLYEPFGTGMWGIAFDWHEKCCSMLFVRYSDSDRNPNVWQKRNERFLDMKCDQSIPLCRLQRGIKVSLV